jgi:hypothetical protein
MISLSFLSEVKGFNYHVYEKWNIIFMYSYDFMKKFRLGFAIFYIIYRNGFRGSIAIMFSAERKLSPGIVND